MGPPKRSNAGSLASWTRTGSPGVHATIPRPKLAGIIDPNMLLSNSFFNFRLFGAAAGPRQASTGRLLKKAEEELAGGQNLRMVTRAAQNVSERCTRSILLGKIPAYI